MCIRDRTDSTDLTFGHTASDLKAVVDDSNAPTDLLYQWYSENGNSLKKITDATAATDTPVSYTHLDVYKRQVQIVAQGRLMRNAPSQGFPAAGHF